MLLEAAQAATVLARAKEIEITIGDLAESPFHGDEDLLRQMVLNLLDNAVKYTPERGKVSVDLEKANGSYLIRVADNGAGIPPEAQSYIFDRFYRVVKIGPIRRRTGVVHRALDRRDPRRHAKSGEFQRCRQHLPGNAAHRPVNRRYRLTSMSKVSFTSADSDFPSGSVT